MTGGRSPDDGPSGGGRPRDEELVYRYPGPPLLELWRWPVGEGRWMHRWDQQGGLPGVIVLATDAHGLVMIRQWRANIGDWIWQLPRGYRDAEDAGPEDAAMRELREETGCLPDATADSPVRVVGRVWVDPGILSTGVDVVEVRIATGQVTAAVDTSRRGPEEIREVRLVAIPELATWIATGELTDGLTLAALARYLPGG